MHIDIKTKHKHVIHHGHKSARDLGRVIHVHQNHLRKTEHHTVSSKRAGVTTDELLLLKIRYEKEEKRLKDEVNYLTENNL